MQQFRQAPLKLPHRQAQQIQRRDVPVRTLALFGKQVEHKRFTPTGFAQHEPEPPAMVHEEPQPRKGFLLRQPGKEYRLGGSRGERCFFQIPVARVQLRTAFQTSSLTKNKRQSEYRPCGKQFFVPGQSLLSA
jgi:hypothetical protein